MGSKAGRVRHIGLMVYPAGPPPDILDLANEDPEASARGLDPPWADAVVTELLARIRKVLAAGVERPVQGLGHRAQSAVNDLLEFMRRMLHHGPGNHRE